MSARTHLPNRRLNETFEVEVGTLRELFITNGKAGSDSDANARDAAIITSIALQYGVPLEVIRHALLRDPRGNASTPLGAALDAIAGGAPP
jgi:hypothetical protein